MAVLSIIGIVVLLFVIGAIYVWACGDEINKSPWYAPPYSSAWFFWKATKDL